MFEINPINPSKQLEPNWTLGSTGGGLEGGMMRLLRVLNVFYF